MTATPNPEPKPGKPSDGTAPATHRVLAALALIAFAAVVYSAGSRAETQNPGLQQGIAAFKAGAYDVAAETLRPLAKANDPDAAWWLAQMYEGGLGVKKDMAKALAWYRTSAENGSVKAELRLGEIYFQGTETLQDFAKARKWLDRAANDGDARAERDLGTLYAKGWGTRRDPVWAYVWYELAARQGDHEAEGMRNDLLKSMKADMVGEAQTLTEKIAPDVLGQTIAKAASPATASHPAKSEAPTPAKDAGPKANAAQQGKSDQG